MEISITLNPKKLSNPDTNLRYDIPNSISVLSDNRIEDNGFDYDDKQNMVIFLTSQNLTASEVHKALENTFKELNIESKAVEVEVTGIV